VGRGFALLDLSLLRQGIRIGWEFGIQSIAELARVGELVERSVYEPSSLATAPGGIRFTLLNPPLRMGAFSSIRLYWDRRPVASEDLAFVPEGSLSPVLGTAVTKETPFVLPVGQRTEVRATVGDVAAGRHEVRLELQSVAIPPVVWFEFADQVRTVGQ
jgi:hypothetical protein